ncbi:MAG: aminomethyltransferase beta-barrel domain-containing protein, partial [Clostridia bacterium]
KLYSDTIKITNINILNKNYLDKKLKCKVRYSSSEIEIDNIIKDSEYYIIKLKEKQKNISPGQYLVAYYDDYVIFSGEIISK